MVYEGFSNTWCISSHQPYSRLIGFTLRNILTDGHRNNLISCCAKCSRCNQSEPRACFSLTTRSHLTVIGDNVTRSVLLRSSLLRNFVLLAVIVEKRTFLVLYHVTDERFAPDSQNKTSSVWQCPCAARFRTVHGPMTCINSEWSQAFLYVHRAPSAKGTAGFFFSCLKCHSSVQIVLVRVQLWGRLIALEHNGTRWLFTRFSVHVKRCISLCFGFILNVGLKLNHLNWLNGAPSTFGSAENLFLCHFLWGQLQFRQNPLFTDIDCTPLDHCMYHQ